MPCDTEGDADSLTARCILIRAFAGRERQTTHLNYRSPRLSEPKMNGVIKKQKIMPGTGGAEHNEGERRGLQAAAQTSISVPTL